MTPGEHLGGNLNAHWLTISQTVHLAIVILIFRTNKSSSSVEQDDSYVRFESSCVESVNLYFSLAMFPYLSSILFSIGDEYIFNAWSTMSSSRMRL